MTSWFILLIFDFLERGETASFSIYIFQENQIEDYIEHDLLLVEEDVDSNISLYF